MPYQATPTDIADVIILDPKVFGDERGYFYESFNARDFREATGCDVSFVQDNHSRSAQGVLRGLHFQQGDHAQGKLVRVVSGVVFDVAVDVRPDSDSFGRWVGVELSETNKRQLWIPAGFAHGFLVLSEFAEFLYKTTTYYAPETEVCLKWDDAEVGIVWPEIASPVQVSGKDAAGIDFGSLRHLVGA